MESYRYSRCQRSQIEIMIRSESKSIRTFCSAPIPASQEAQQARPRITPYRAQTSQIADNSKYNGRIHRQIRRAFIASSGAPLRIGQLLEWCYPAAKRDPRWHRTNIHRALPRFAVSLRRISDRPGRPCVFGPNAELRRLIGH